MSRKQNVFQLLLILVAFVNISDASPKRPDGYLVMTKSGKTYLGVSNKDKDEAPEILNRKYRPHKWTTTEEEEPVETKEPQYEDSLEKENDGETWKTTRTTWTTPTTTWETTSKWKPPTSKWNEREDEYEYEGEVRADEDSHEGEE